MNRIAVAKELVKLAAEITFEDVSPVFRPEERKNAEKMKAKGYAYMVQVDTVDGPFGDPLYFKSSNEIGPFLRSFPSYTNAKTKWVVKL